MSSLLYPTLPGAAFSSFRSPLFKSGVQEAVSGVVTGIAFMQYARTRFTLTYEVLRDYLTPSEIKTLVGFFMSMQGRANNFLFNDPEFNSAIFSPFGTGDGTTELFALTATYEATSGGPGGAELIQNFNGAISLYANGVTINPSTYTLGPSLTPSVNAGFVLFNTPPASGVALTWSGNFYYLCRFDEDIYDFEKFMYALWTLKKVSFTSELS